MDSLQAQIKDELRRILAVVEELTGLSSRWKGTVEIVPDADFKGKKRFSCGIEVQWALAEQDLRWATLIHESLHCVSAGYNRDDYQAFRGWEEGVVEQLQRLLRPEILARLGVRLDERLFADNEIKHYYNPFIEALESLRQALNLPDTPADKTVFYIELLRIPLRARSAYLLGRGYQERIVSIDYVAKFSRANATLRRRLL